MPGMLENIIVAVLPDPKTHTVAVTWGNGERTVNNFGHLVGKGVFASFGDPAVFARVRVGDRGRSLEWPGEIDFCADALWFDVHPADAPQQSQRPTDHPARQAALRTCTSAPPLS